VSKIPKQMEDTVAARSIMAATEVVSEGMLDALVGTFVLNLVF
jgi:hypothetical protein